MEFVRKKNDMSKYNNHKLMCLDLELILTQKCNLSCAHCLRGCSGSKEISEEVLDDGFKEDSFKEIAEEIIEKIKEEMK